MPIRETEEIKDLNSLVRVITTDDAGDHTGSDWSAFCKSFYPDDKNDEQYKVFMEGLAINTGYGDGEYPVYIRKVDGRPMQIFIDFDDPGEDD